MLTALESNVLKFSVFLQLCCHSFHNSFFSIRLVVYFSKLVFNLKAASLVIGIQNSSAR